jgi:pyruvate formate lyase activating enzyme
VLSFLKARQGMLEGVVICGGEPTVQPDLIEKMRQIKFLGYSLKLDTNGLNPGKLEEIIRENLVDYIAMDVKDALPYRKDLMGVTVNPDLIRKSIKIIINSGIRHEFRSTIMPSKHSLEVLKSMAGEIVNSEKWVLQRFRSMKTLDKQYEQMTEFSTEDMRFLSRSLQEYNQNLEIRI